MRRTWTALKALLSLVFAVLCIALLGLFLVGPAVAVEVAGAQAPGEVVAREETISPLNVTWSRRLTLDVRYRPADAGDDEIVRVPVDADAYDQTAVGAQVTLRYLPADGLFGQLGNSAGARLASQGPFGALAARLSPLGPYLLGLLVGLGFAAAWATWRRWWFGAGLFGVIVGGGLLAGTGWQPPLPGGEQLSAQATVRGSALIERVWGGKRTRSESAAQPFRVVELVFVPAGRSAPVVAVDLVDEGSVPALASGSTVAIRYSAANPRRAQIEGATRTYAWKNLRTFALIGLLFGGLALWAWRRRRVPPTPRGK